MESPAPQAPALRIPTRDIVLAFILAKLVAVVAGALPGWKYPELGHVAVPFAHAIAALLFVLLVMQGGRQSLRAVIAATAIGRRMPSGHPVGWLLLAMAAGVLMRLGTSGLVLGTLELLDADAATAQFADLLAAYQEPAFRVTLLLVAARLVGAAEEEITYRRILQSHFCRRYGLGSGVLLVAIAFGAMHLDPQAVVAGLCLTLMYLVSGRLWVPVIAHACNNLTYPAMVTLGIPLVRAPFFVICHAAAAVLIVSTILAFRSVGKAPGIYGRP